MTIPNEEVESWIKDMGYVTVTPRVIESSLYKLKDGTIIKALIHINHLIQDPRSPQGFGINSSNIIISYTPKAKRNPTAFQPFNPAEIQTGVIDDDMEPEPLRENFSVYDLSNGMVLSVKTVAGQISKTKFYTPDGEPVYLVNTTPVVKVKKA
jgi:hypothetical protein